MIDFQNDKEIAIKDPVCGRSLNLDQVVDHEDYAGWAYFFCSRACHEKFVSDPKRYALGENVVPSRSK